VLELLDQMLLETQCIGELADQLVSCVEIGGEFVHGGRHTLEYGKDRPERQAILNELCEFISCSRGSCRWKDKAALPPRVLQVNALEDGGHLGGRDFDAIALGRWEAEDPSLQALRPNHVAVAVPMEDLDAIATPIEKNEEVTGEWILSDDRRGQGRQPVKPASHVGRRSGQENPDGRREADHDRCSKTSRS
jgi:hypothetical protein